jgi:HK97 family phage major capsid protein
MSKIAELQQRRAALRDEALQLLNTAVDGVLPGENEERYQKIDGDIDAIGKQIEREERMRKLTIDDESRQVPLDNPSLEGRQQITQTPEYHNAFLAHIRGIELSGEQRKVLNAGRVTEGRALSGITGNIGGYTVPTGFYGKMEAAQKLFSGMRNSRATILRTDGGNDLPIPTANDTGNVGEIVGENVPVTGGDTTFGQVIMKAYKYSSKVVLVPFELLMDTAIDLESYLASILGERIGRIQNTHFTVGDNTNKPQGAVNGAALGKLGANGQTVSVTYDDLVDLFHSVDVAYRTNSEFMLNDNSVKVLRKLKDSTGQPLWQPGMVAGQPDTILSRPYIVNNDMANMAASAKSILFGDMSKYFIRDAMGQQLFRITDKYIESGQVGFLVFSRSDGRLVDAGTNPIKYYQNSAT